MNKNIFVLAALVSAMGSVSAMASDGTINFVGTINDITCTVDVKGPTNTSTVTLPTVSTSTLRATGATAGVVPFTVALDGCTQGGGTQYKGSTAKVSVYFEPGATVDLANGTLKNGATSGAATNVDLQLLDGGVTGNVIKVGDASQLTGNKQIILSATGTTTLPYAVRYHATGASTAGSVTSSVVYDVVYN
ncbi:TPA: fimbrial protein [Enterobacter hormaechei]